MDWESFDLFEEHAFEAVLSAGDPETMLAYAYLSFLRWRVFTQASALQVGLEEFNQTAAAYSEMWYIKLVCAWSAANGNVVDVGSLSN